MKDFIKNEFTFDNLITVLSNDLQRIYKESINNALLVKILQDVRLISQDKILCNDGEIIVNFILWLLINN